MPRRLQFIAAIGIASFLSIAVIQASQLPGRGGGTVSGRIVGAEGQPVAGVRVGAQSIPDTPSTRDTVLMSLTQTDRDGNYRLENVPAGRYYIVADRLDAPVYFPGVTNSAEARVVTVADGAAVENQDFRLSAQLWLSVRGHVIREGHALSDEVVLRNVGSPMLTAKVATDGSFEFPIVRRGTYQLTVLSTRLPPVEVVVNDQDITNLEVRVPISALVDPTVTIATKLDGAGPLPRFTLQLTTTTNQRSVTMAGSVILVRLPFGEYRVTLTSAAAPLPAGYFVKSITAGTTDLLTQTLKVTPAEIPQVLVTLGVTSPPPWISLKGRVTGYELQGTPGSIRMESFNLESPLTATVNNDGSFEFPTVLPDSYQVRITPSADPFARTIVVRAGGTSFVEVPWKLPSLKVEGRAESPPLQPTQFLRAQLRPENPSNQLIGPTLAGPFLSRQVAADGTFSFSPIQPGPYILSIGICEADVCMFTGGVNVEVLDRDVTSLVVSASSQLTPPQLLPARPWTTPSPETIEGVVVVEGDAAPPAFQLRFTAPTVARTVAINGKSFTASMPPGDYRITVAELPPGYEVRSIKDGGFDLRVWPFPVTASSALPGLARRITVTLGRN